jgi:hypothetical protein
MGLKGDQKRYPSRLSASREAPRRAVKTVKATTASPTITQPSQTWPCHPPRRVSHRLFRLKPQQSHDQCRHSTVMRRHAQPSPAMRLATKPPRASGASICLSTPAALRTEIHRGRMTTTTVAGKSESRPAQGGRSPQTHAGKGWPMGRAACMGPAGNMIQFSAQRFLTRSPPGGRRLARLGGALRTRRAGVCCARLIAVGKGERESGWLPAGRGT